MWTVFSWLRLHGTIKEAPNTLDLNLTLPLINHMIWTSSNVSLLIWNAEPIIPTMKPLCNKRYSNRCASMGLENRKCSITLRVTKWLAFKNIINATFVGQISVPKEVKNSQNDGADFTYLLVIKMNDNLLIFK